MSIRDGLFWFGFGEYAETFCPECRCPESSGEHGMDCSRYYPSP